MLDLSSNNSPLINWERVKHGGTRRVYIKLTEGSDYLNPYHKQQRPNAHKAGLDVGEYHFARPSKNTPREEAQWFLEHLPTLAVGKDLRPCLDLEDPQAKPSRSIGVWAVAWLAEVQRRSGHVTIIYGSPSYLEDCRLPAAVAHHPLWLASYGRNDGKEHPFTCPPPWHHVAAHQYATVARVAGVPGHVDISHVFHGEELDVQVTR